jgi:hypothetical protein
VGHLIPQAIHAVPRAHGLGWGSATGYEKRR